MNQILGRSVRAAGVVLSFLLSSVGMSEEAKADPLFCRKSKAEVQRLELELRRVGDDLSERDQRNSALSQQLLTEKARVRSLKSEIAMLRGEEVEISECLAFSASEMKLAPVGTRCRYGDQANAIAEKVASNKSAHAWRDSSGLVWDLAQGRGKVHWIIAYQVCKDQRTGLPKMGDFRRAEASGFLRSVINPVRGYDEVHTGYEHHTATLSSPVRFEYRLSAGVWGDFSFICVW